jgi:hypothetical protein
VRKSTKAKKRIKSLLSPLTIKARDSNAITNRERYVTVQSNAANFKLNNAKRPKKGSEVGG